MRVPAGLLMLAVMAGASAAPAPKDGAKNPVYYATVVGTEFVYERAGKQGKLVVTAAEEKDGAVVVTVSHADRPGKDPEVYETVEVSRRGVARSRLGPWGFDPPEWMLQPPADPLPRWSVDTPARPGLAATKADYVVTGTEVVEVPAGKFRCVRVDGRFTEDGAPGRTTSWYAENIGLVKWECGKNVKVLVSFKPGKK